MQTRSEVPFNSSPEILLDTASQKVTRFCNDGCVPLEHKQKKQSRARRQKQGSVICFPS